MSWETEMDSEKTLLAPDGSGILSAGGKGFRVTVRLPRLNGQALVFFP
jgi:hypothetical protein